MRHTTKYLSLCKKVVLDSIDQSKYAVFLFGSRASGIASKKSDIDIGVLGKQTLTLKEKFQIQSKLEDKDIPYKVDIVDFLKVDAKFKKIALHNIIIWNQPNDLKIK